MTKQTLEQKCVAALTVEPAPSLAEMLTLVAELEAAIIEADLATVTAQTALLDPIASPDYRAAKAAVELTEFVGDRLRSLHPKLSGRASEISVEEDRAEWRIDFASAAEKRNGLSAELRQLYPKVVSQLVDLFNRIAANDRKLSQLHQSRPSGAKGQLLGAELTARGLTGFTRDQPSILGRDRLQLPDWTDSSRMAWPAPQTPASVLLSESIAATHDDPRRHSADWHEVLKEDGARRVAEEQQRVEQEAAHVAEDKAAYERSLPR